MPSTDSVESSHYKHALCPPLQSAVMDGLIDTEWLGH